MYVSGTIILSRLLIYGKIKFGYHRKLLCLLTVSLNTM